FPISYSSLLIACCLPGDWRDGANRHLASSSDVLSRDPTRRHRCLPVPPMSKPRPEGGGGGFPPTRRGARPTLARQPITLTVADNDFITILGPSRCGKSALL